MAWTNVKDEALPRFAKLGRILGIDETAAAGRVMYLWRNSQNVLAEAGTREQLIDWLLLEGEDAATVDRWLSALERVPFISKDVNCVDLSLQTWRIHGNDTEIDNIVQQRSKSAKGGDATREKWKRIREERASRARGPTPSMPAGMPQLGSLHGSARLGTAHTEIAAPAAPISVPPPPSEKDSDLLLTGTPIFADLDPANHALPPASGTPCEAAETDGAAVGGTESPTDPAPDVFPDPLRNDWLRTVCRLAEKTIAAWRAEYGPEKLRCGLGEAHADWCADQDEFFAPILGKFQSERSRISQKLRRYIANADPPPVAEVLPFAGEKAGKSFCGSCDRGWKSLRDAKGMDFSMPCECAAKTEAG